MNKLHIIGTKKSGKTAQVCFLLGQLSARGYRIGSWKHSSHTHPVDKPGADSDRHRAAGAQPSVFQTPGELGIYYNTSDPDEINRMLNMVFDGCDLVLVESFRRADGPKILVTDNLSDAEGVSDIRALISRENPGGIWPVFKPSGKELVDFVEQTFIKNRPE